MATAAVSPARLARVLVIAGSDSGGGAGIQADIKTITALGGYAATALTALTAQDTTGVHGVHSVPLNFLRLQIERVLDDIGADAIKIGMIGDAGAIDLVADILAGRPELPPVVLDPVMIAKGGQRLLASDAIDTFKRRLLPLAAVVTPNVPEAEALSGMVITDKNMMLHAAEAMLTLGVAAVLVKGGHLDGEVVTDILATEAGPDSFNAPRIQTRHTHGTGCTLSSAIATGLAQGLDLRAAVIRARAYVRAAIATAPGFGAGHGPLNHGVTLDPAWRVYSY